MEENEKDNIALHVLVVGFHHKRGMQVEYCYPPLHDNDISSCELPEPWKHLPSLCLPDGAHNHEADTIFFHLPHLTNPELTVFGVSCYRQIDAEKVTIKTADITRNTVQKSVCVLCSLPIYGYIQERLQVTTRVYFKGGDFADVRDLEGLYHDLNTTNWRDKLHHGCSVTECVRCFGRNLVVLFKLMLLERGVLIYHSPVSPVAKTIVSLMALLPHTLPQGVMASAATNNLAELLPDLEDLPDSGNALKVMNGKDSSLNSSTDSALERSVETKTEGTPPAVAQDLFTNACSAPTDSSYKSLDSVPSIDSKDDTVSSAPPAVHANTKRLSSVKGESQQMSIETVSVDSSSNAVASSTVATTGADTPTNTLQDSLSDLRSSNSSLTSVTSRASFMSPLTQEEGGVQSPPLSSRLSSLKGRLTGAFSYWTSGRDKNSTSMASPPTPASSPAFDEEETNTLPLTPSSGAPLVFPELQQQLHSPDQEQAPAVAALVPSPPEVFASLAPAECGLPLPLFTKGYLVHPYLSLQQLEVLSSPRTKAFLAGASNTLFLHKRPLYDVLVQVSEGKVEILDPELRRQLALSTEDLRFADNIVKQVEAVSGGLQSPGGGPAPTVGVGGVQPQPLDVWVEGVGWAGGEEWLRHQFRVYLLTLMRTSLLPEGSREVEMFNSCFVSAWRETRHYQQWCSEGPYPQLLHISPCHPNAGHLSISDVRIRLQHSLLGGDRSRRINQTIASTGTAVKQTKEAVGGALTSAKGALSSLWSSITTATPSEVTEMGSEVSENTTPEAAQIAAEVTERDTTAEGVISVDCAEIAAEVEEAVEAREMKASDTTEEQLNK